MVDSEETSISSIQHSPEDDALQIYGFDADTQIELTSILDTDNYDIMVREKYDNGRQVVYSPLSGLQYFDVNSDTDDAAVNYSSIEKNVDADNKHYFGLYNFQQDGSDRTLTVRLEYDGARRYIHTAAGSDAAPDPTL